MTDSLWEVGRTFEFNLSFCLHAARAQAAVPPETPIQRGAASGKRLVLVKAEFAL